MTYKEMVALFGEPRVGKVLRQRFFTWSSDIPAAPRLSHCPITIPIWTYPRGRWAESNASLNDAADSKVKR
jgi:hypothetical protein